MMVVWLESAMARLCVPQALPGAPSAAIFAPSLGSSLIVDPWILKNFLWKSGTVCSMEQTSLSHPLGVAGPGLWLSPVLPLCWDLVRSYTPSPITKNYKWMLCIEAGSGIV